ncbi:MAG TPA: CRISPR-associated endonuclease Cas2 [Candidatus Atribacteria bacterium]|nr:CRISPR-associated endonuclease Cas2 [Candidatus Atribacteria bacterium]
MYIIIVYDVNEKRVSKVCQFLRQYLNWIQNSVFEGELTRSQFFEIKAGLKKLLNEDEDSVIIYKMHSHHSFSKEHMGIEKTNTSHII